MTRPAVLRGAGSQAYGASLGRQKVEQKGVSPIFIVGPAVCGLAVVIASAVLIQALGIEALGLLGAS